MTGHYTFASRIDVYNFKRGMPIAWSAERGYHIPSRRARFAAAIKNSVLRPLRRKYVVTSIDAEAGVITVGEKPAFWRFL